MIQNSIAAVHGGHEQNVAEKAAWMHSAPNISEE